MGNSTLHAIAIQGLRHSNPSFYQEYCLLTEGISAQIREFAKKHADYLDYTSFIESYDRASHEPVLKVAIGTQKVELCIHIHIHKDHHFVIGKSGSGEIANDSKAALMQIAKKLGEIEA